MSYLDQVIDLWNKSNTALPSGIRVYSSVEQGLRETRFDEFSNAMKSKKIAANISSEGLKKEKATLIGLLTDFFRDSLDYSTEQLDTILSDAMVNSTWSFLKAAKRYDPELNPESAFQALRNVWILNGLQFLLGKKVELTASIFAYSMLYPYTDNYLDDAGISAMEKFAFGERFADRLAGRDICPLNRHEEKIYQMVELIEGEWSRAHYPELYKSLLDIHAAQSESVKLIEGVAELNFDERLKISIQKGGTSVVADGFLIAGKLTGKQEQFLYAYGAYLQLLDDFQDVSDDLNSRVLTAFSASARSFDLDLLLNRTYHLGQEIVKLADSIGSGAVAIFQSLMRRSIDLFLVEAVQSNAGCFSQTFRADFNQFSPLSFAYIENQNDKFSPYQNQLFERFVEQAMRTSDEDEGELFRPKKSLLKQQA
ncbi:hypothetical protein [Mangrovibacterium sp.]|uniref:hypothetical protein n=1 Tax=Mangrovibacterium sp. TaxID=1961364 RepID=UPI0035633F9F